MEQYKKICILLQGPILYVDDIIEYYSDYKNNIIISTNNISNDDYKILINKGFSVIINPIARISGKTNFNNQILNTSNGIKIAKKNGFTYIFKIRTDIFIHNINNLLKHLIFDKNIIYSTAYHNWDGGYLCEHMFFGEINIMNKIWSIPESDSELAPEVQLTNHINTISDISEIKFIFPILFQYNIIAFWKKKGFNLNEYKKDTLFSYEYKIKK